MEKNKKKKRRWHCKVASQVLQSWLWCNRTPESRRDIETNSACVVQWKLCYEFISNDDYYYIRKIVASSSQILVVFPCLLFLLSVLRTGTMNAWRMVLTTFTVRAFLCSHLTSYSLFYDYHICQLLCIVRIMYTYIRLWYFNEVPGNYNEPFLILVTKIRVIIELKIEEIRELKLLFLKGELLF